MVFNSLDFLVFFTAVYGLYLVLQHRAQNLLLLGASYVFYGYWDWRFLALLLASTGADYLFGLRIGDTADPRRKKGWLWASMVVNLGVLFFFKYFNFFADSAIAALNALGFDGRWDALHIVLPVGISFYTFQSMSYTVDVYRGDLKPTRSLTHFALYVAYFPQLVAGPIERATHLLHQMSAPRRPTYDQLREGFWLILHGYFLKVVLADNLAPFVDEVFKNPAGAKGMQIPLAVVAFAFQIYGDFGGYSSIARGISKWLGVDLMVNFRMPYFAVNPSDFWRRWHISLSTWLRDYLYIPLGGNRGGESRTYRNLFLTMVLGGLWHGAAWHFVAWGVFHGLLLIGHRLLQPHLPGGPGLGWRLTRVALFLPCTLFGWLLFRVEELGHLPLLWHNLTESWVWNGKLCALTLLCFALPVVLVDLIHERRGHDTAVSRMGALPRTALYLLWFAIIVLCGVRGNHAFIYFQF